MGRRTKGDFSFHAFGGSLSITEENSPGRDVLTFESILALFEPVIREMLPLVF